MYTSIAASQLQEEKIIVLFPVGSIEQHGPHLPIDTDLRIASLLAEKIAELFPSNKVLRLPALPFSCSWEHRGAGTLSLSNSTISSIVFDIAYSLKAWNNSVFLVLLNWHGGNSLLASLTTEVTAKTDIPTIAINTISIATDFWYAEQKNTITDIHAGAIETSIIQAFWPEVVNFDNITGITTIPNIEDSLVQHVFQALGTHAVTKNGVWGDPQQADINKGKSIVEAVTEEVHQRLLTLSDLINKYKQ